MMVAKGAPIFLDTNIFLRYNIVEMPEHSVVSMAVERLIDAGHLLWISRQVMREFSVVLTRPQTFLKPFTSAEVAARLKLLLPLFPVADETEQVAAILLTLMEQIPMGGKQIHDANITASMLANGIPYLFTLNPSDFIRFSNHITILKLEEILKNDSD